MAYGLALQGLKRARLLTNLLPGEIRIERLVQAKKPWAVAAAAALLLAVGGLALSYAFEYRTYGDSRVKDAIKESDKVSDKAKKAQDEFDAAVKQAKEEEAAVRTIVAGQFERDNWLQLVKFVNTAIPQPDAREERVFSFLVEDDEPEEVAIPDIPEEFKKRYWLDKPGGADTMSGKQAYEEYLHRQLAGPSTKDDGSASAADDLPPGAEDLIQYNIESVQALFCDDLSNYWKQVLDSPRVKNSREAMVRPQTDYAKKPEGAGWIIEVQGYTYHRDAETFVRTTLLENLARLGNPTPPKADAPAGGAPAAPAPTAPGPGQPRAGEAAPASNMGPVINHISHVVLYQYQRSSAKGPLELLGSNVHSQVRTMALTAAPAAGGGTLGGQPSGMMGGQPSGMMGGSPNQGGGADKPAPTGPSRDTWTPLGEAAAASGAGRGAQFPGAGRG